MSVALAVLYVVVVMMAVRFCGARGIAIVAAGCVSLTLLTYVCERETLANAIIGVIAIGLTAFIAIKAQSAEEAARRSEAEWREVFEHNPVMYFMVDFSGKILSVNAFGAAQLGYCGDDLKAQSVFKMCPESDRQRVRENLDLCLENLDQSNTWEAQKIRKDGSTLWTRENAKAIERSKGDVIILIACENIQDRKRAEEAVRESARRFRAVIEYGYDVVLLLESDGSVLYASPSAERVLGYPPRELVGGNGFDLIHPDQVEDIRNRFVAWLDQGGGVLRSEWLFRHKYGTWLWGEVTITNLLAETSVRAVVVNLRDITQRKQAEEALRESEQRFRDYAEAASDWFWESGPDHRFTNLSHQALFHATGIGARRWDLAADLDEEPGKWAAHRAILDAHEPFRDFTYKATRPDGSVAHISASGTPLFDRHRRFLGYRGVARDVSDTVRAKQSERALQDTRMQLGHVARVTSLGELTASIAHEINQP